MILAVKLMPGYKPKEVIGAQVKAYDQVVGKATDYNPETGIVTVEVDKDQEEYVSKKLNIICSHSVNMKKNGNP